LDSLQRAGEKWRAFASVEQTVEVHVGDLCDCVLDMIEILSAQLERRAMVPAVGAWCAEADLEIPFYWNRRPGEGAARPRVHAARRRSCPRQGRREEADASERRLRREWPLLDGLVCTPARPALALEFAHRHRHEYKKVLCWVHGEARYLRQSYLKHADHLGIAVGDSFLLQSTGWRAAARSLRDIEGDAIAKINKELARDPCTMQLVRGRAPVQTSASSP